LEGLEGFGRFKTTSNNEKKRTINTNQERNDNVSENRVTIETEIPPEIRAHSMFEYRTTEPGIFSSENGQEEEIGGVE